jgi:hypothetical protein
MTVAIVAPTKARNRAHPLRLVAAEHPAGGLVLKINVGQRYYLRSASRFRR